ALTRATCGVGDRARTDAVDTRGRSMALRSARPPAQPLDASLAVDTFRLSGNFRPHTPNLTVGAKLSLPAPTSRLRGRPRSVRPPRHSRFRSETCAVVRMWQCPGLLLGRTLQGPHRRPSGYDLWRSARAVPRAEMWLCARRPRVAARVRRARSARGYAGRDRSTGCVAGRH